MLQLSSYPIIWAVVFGAGLIAMIGLSRLVSITVSRWPKPDHSIAQRLNLILAIWFVCAVAYALVIGLSFDTFLPALVVPLTAGTSVLFMPGPKRVLQSIPLHLLVMLGSYRVAGAIFVYAYEQHGLLSYGFAFNAGWGDVLTGVLAPLVAYAVFKGWRGAFSLLVVWTCIGVGDLILAPISANLYGAQRLVDFPLNFIPLFLGPPFGILLHTVTLRAAWLQRQANR